MTEIRVTKTNIAAQIRSQMLIFLKKLEKRSWKNLCNIPTAPTIRQIKN